MLKVASHSIHTETIFMISETLLGLIFGILIVILPKFFNTMSELALVSISTVTLANKISTELVF